MRILLLCNGTWHLTKAVWVNHGPKNIVCLSIHIYIPSFIISQDAKEIIPFNLVCPGLTHSSDPGIFHSTKYGTSWLLLQVNEISMIHTELIANLCDLPYGLFHIMVNLVGLPLEQQIVRTSKLVKYPLIKHS